MGYSEERALELHRKLFVTVDEFLETNPHTIPQMVGEAVGMLVTEERNVAKRSDEETAYEEGFLHGLDEGKDHEVLMAKYRRFYPEVEAGGVE